jgi:glycosyltransferase involved in cell wall biosynthesis
MLNNQKIVVVMPAYNAERTLEKTFRELDRTIIDEVIVVDDFSSDRTVEICKRLGIRHVVHPKNLGYGANQKTCYTEALNRDADIVIMVHPDYQYAPKLAPALAAMLASGVYDVAVASRILGNGALKGGMPRYKYVANRCLTLIQNLLCNAKLSEFHTGYRAFTRKVLASLPLVENSNDFVFDNEMLGQIIYFNFRLGEISCPTKYFKEASSINFFRSVKYGFGVIAVSLKVLLQRAGLFSFRILDENGRRLLSDAGLRR